MKNFLAWLAEDDNTHCVFNLIMRSWTDNANWSLDTENVTIKREYNHFDFCVCDNVTGGVQLVLENKFKSIAYKAQLENYKEKSLRNTVVHPNYVLLTLAEEFIDKEAIQNLGWKIVSYADYAKILREGAKQIKVSFYQELIEQNLWIKPLKQQKANKCTRHHLHPTTLVTLPVGESVKSTRMVRSSLSPRRSLSISSCSTIT